MENFNSNPIILVEDDEDDYESTVYALNELKYSNEIIWYRNGDELLHGMLTDMRKPFLIICDINLPRKNGLMVRKQLCDDKRLKFQTIPFVFWSTSATDAQVAEAFELWSQGVFEKPSSLDELQELLNGIIFYWKKCGHPKTGSKH